MSEASKLSVPDDAVMERIRRARAVLLEAKGAKPIDPAEAADAPDAKWAHLSDSPSFANVP
jgi:hypothetical protein